MLDTDNTFQRPRTFKQSSSSNQNFPDRFLWRIMIFDQS